MKLDPHRGDTEDKERLLQTFGEKKKKSPYIESMCHLPMYCFSAPNPPFKAFSVMVDGILLSISPSQQAVLSFLVRRCRSDFPAGGRGFLLVPVASPSVRDGVEVNLGMLCPRHAPDHPRNAATPHTWTLCTAGLLH